MTAAIPKAELHCHIEGAVPPDLIRRLADRNDVTLPAGLFGPEGGYAYRDFPEFLRAYDLASACIRTSRDYRDITYSYFCACADEGAIYLEIFVSPNHATSVGLDYATQMEGIVAGIEAAERDRGIVGRIIVTCVRHLGPERALAVAEAMRAEPHPLIVGFGMGGDESRLHPRDFAPAFALADAAGYGCTVHAGEVCGPESVRAALGSLPVSRLGHGVRAVEDPTLLDEIARRGIVLEVCPGSNLALGLYEDYDAHPLKRLLAAGCRVTLNSDDPPYFGTSLGREYAMAARHFDLGTEELETMTRTAIEAAFADGDTRARLLARLEPGATGAESEL